jgi:hypothetical protein|nr:MAG TPA: hypothetical protein [Caudoviricetes sp.]
MKLKKYKIDQANILARALFLLTNDALKEENYGKTLRDYYQKTRNDTIFKFLFERLDHVRRFPTYDMFEDVRLDFNYYTAQMFAYKVMNPKLYPSLAWYIQHAYRLDQEEFEQFITQVRSVYGILSAKEKLESTYTKWNTQTGKGVMVHDPELLLLTFLKDPKSMSQPGYAVIRNALVDGIPVYDKEQGREIGRVYHLYLKDAQVKANISTLMEINTIGCVLSPVYESEVGILDLEYLNEIIRFDLVKIIQM